MSIVLFSKSNCVQCKATERVLNKIGVEYTVRDMGQDEEAREMAVSLGYMQAPVVVAPNGHWSGFQPDKIKEAAALVAA